MEYLVNQQIKLPFLSIGLATGQTTFTTTFLNNGAVVSVTPTFTEIGSGLYVMTFVPAVTGKWAVFIQGQILPLEVVSKTLQNLLGDLTDESLGSWTWNKGSGLLTLFRADSSTLATYMVLDTVDAASRERLT